MFDAGLVPGDKPRLFIDMLAFVEMARDRRTYRFLQDTRYGRITLIENDHLGPLVEAVTNYVARRLVEREKALASDQTLPPVPPPLAAPVTPAPTSTPSPAPAPIAGTAAAEPEGADVAPRTGQIRIRRPDTWQSQTWPQERQPRGSSLLRGLVNTLALVVLILLLGAAVYFSAQEWTRPY